MRGWTLATLPLLAAALGACASIEAHQISPQASPLPEPPPWNSIEMMWMDTEVVHAAPIASPLST
jgi:hypothetical protein